MYIISKSCTSKQGNSLPACDSECRHLAERQESTALPAAFHSLDVLAKPLDLVGHMVQLEHVVDPLEQCGVVHVLRQKVVGAGLDSTLNVAELVQRGDHQNHDVTSGRIALELLADFEAAGFRHHDVEEHQMRLEGGNFIERVLPIDCHGRFDI